VVSHPIIVAVGIAAGGHREVLGFDIGDTESQSFWTEFPRSLKARGLDGARLVSSDAQTGLIAAFQNLMHGESWQRYRVWFMRNVFANVPKSEGSMVASITRTIFAQPDGKHVHAQFDEAVRVPSLSHLRIAGRRPRRR